MNMLAGNALLALLAALTWGGGDFAGGMAVKQAGGTLPSALRVVLLSHGVSFLALLAAILLLHQSLPHGAPLAWGFAAGLFGGLSVLSFYICLARGAMGVSAAISGLLAAAIPSLASVLLEGPPSLSRLLGFLLAGSAIWLIAAGSSPTTVPVTRGTLALSIASGAGFGLYFVALRMAGSAGLLWPLALSRSVSITLCLAGLLTLSLRSPYRNAHQPFVSLAVVRWALLTALLDTIGNLFFIAATRAGRLDVAAVLASLYPASTILLAAWLLKERPGRQQGLGMALAAVAVVLITL